MAQAEQPKTNNSRYTQEYFDIARSLGPDCAGRRSAYAYMQNSSAIVHHQVVATSFIPRLFDKATYEVMKDTAETAHRIASQVMAHYLDDASYRKIFHYDPRMADLILAPRGYDAILPFARFDTFLNEDTLDIAFCEFNADGSSGMNENREITNSIKGTATFKEFARRHQVQGCELFESWVEDFLAIYKTYEQAKENPRVAIVDYLENGVVDEFRIFTKIFADHGIECIVEDVRALRFDGTVLKDRNGKTIDAIWRRCVSNDLMQFWDASQDLIRAVKRGKVALIGSFAGHIVHDKQLFEALFHEATLDFLSAEEREFVKKTVPRTTHLDSRFIDLDEILENKNSWIIKPTDHYGAEDVFAGKDFRQDAWVQCVKDCANGNKGYPFIAQRYITAYKTATLKPDRGIETLSDAEISWDASYYNNLNGLYLYDGKFQGVFSRLGPYPTISKPREGITQATIWVDLEQ